MFTVLLGMWVSTATAATRTVCLEFEIEDARTACPTSGAGVTRACDPGNEVNPVGFQYELWDADGTDPADDDLILTVRIGATGQRCITFEWENSVGNVDAGEAHPDVYPKLKNRTSAPGGVIHIIGMEGDGTAYPITTFRANVFTDCTGTCTIAGGTVLSPGTDPSTNKALMHMSIDSAQRTLVAFNGAFETDDGDIDFFVDELADLPWDCGSAQTLSRTEICMPDTLAGEGDRAAHELGHVLHMREFNQNGLPGACDGDWGMSSSEPDGCVAREGFASYAAAVAWWSPGNSSSAPVIFDTAIEPAASMAATCTAAAAMPGHGARAFWDLDDAGVDPGAGITLGFNDLSNLPSNDILNVFADFPNGIFNRQNDELGNNGGNIWDYDVNAGHGATDNETFVLHNCLGAQNN